MENKENKLERIFISDEGIAETEDGKKVEVTQIGNPCLRCKRISRGLTRVELKENVYNEAPKGAQYYSVGKNSTSERIDDNSHKLNYPVVYYKKK